MKQYNVLYMSMSGEMIGGGQKSLFLLLERLNREKYKPILICPSYGNFIKKIERLGIETSLMKTGRLRNPNIFAFVSTIRKLSKFIRQNNIDLIHTDARRQTIYAGVAAKLTKTPLVWHVRISDPEIKQYDKILSFLASKVIAVSKAVEARLEKSAPQSTKTIVIYNGINLVEYGPQPPDEILLKELGIEKNCILIGTASQLIPSKGHGVFVESAARVIESIPEAKFIIIGNGNESYKKELFDQSKELGIENKVIFAGYRENIPQLINLMDIVVLPSTHPEGFSRLILEAMASFKPVIATAVGGNPEAVENGTTGFIVKAGDVDNLAQAISKLAQNEILRNHMGIAGRKRVEEFFSIEKNVALTEKVYEELLCR